MPADAVVEAELLDFESFRMEKIPENALE